MYILDNILFDFLLKIIAVAKKKRNDKRVPLIIRLGAWLLCIAAVVVRYILIPGILGYFSYLVLVQKNAFFIVMFALFLFSCTPYYRLIKKFIKKHKESSVDINNDPFDMDNKINHVE